MLIGIVGFISSGKGTVGDILVNDYDFEMDSFAKPLKDAISIIFGWDRKMLEGDTDESREFREKKDKFWSDIVGYDLSPRLALQLFGTECIREVFSPDVWSSSLILRYEQHGLNTVATDCRFGNEVDAIRTAGGQIWRVRRGEDPEWYNSYLHLFEEKNFENIEILRKKGYFPHVSETAWIGSKFDNVIDNNGSLNDLKLKIDHIMQNKANTMDDVNDLHECKHLDFFGG